MKILQSFLILLLSTILFCCHSGDNSKKPIFIEAEELLKNAPDSALVFLEDTSVFKSLNEKEVIEYQLLLIEALDKNYKPIIDNDSILNEILEKLSSKKDAFLFAKSLFYKGRIMYELNYYKEAIDFFLQGIQILPKEERFTLQLSKLYSSLALAYFEHALFDYALDTYRINHQLDLQVQNQHNIAMSLRNTGLVFLAKEESDSAYFYFNQALDIALQYKNDELSDIIYNDLIYCYREIEEDYEKAISFFYQIKNPTDNTFANIGETYFMAGSMDSARFHLLKGIESPKIETRAGAYYSLANLEISLKNYAASIEYLHHYIDLIDSVYLVSQNNEVERIIYKNKLDGEKLRIEALHNQKIIILVFVSVVILFIIFFLYYASNRKKKMTLYKNQNKLLLQQEKLRAQKDKIDALNYSIDRIKNELNISEERESKLKEFIQRKEEIENNLIECQHTIFKEKKSYRMIEKFMKLSDIDDKPFNYKEQEKLQEDIFSAYVLFINQLKMECPSLGKGEILLCCLLKLGVQYKRVHLLFGYLDSNAIRQRKLSIKRKMLDSENPCESLYNSIFSDKTEYLNGKSNGNKT